MDARNLTRRRVLGEVRRYSSPWMKALGLMFRLKPPAYAVHFPFKDSRRVSIHMLFVFFPLDILWIEHGRVTEARTLTPFTAYSAAATDVLELPAGTIRRTGTRPGDEVRLPKGI